MRIRILVTALAALTLVVGPAMPSYAETSGTALPKTVPANLQGRLKVACARVPNLITRTNNLLTRLPAGPDTTGSIAWVEAKAQTATDHKRTQVATALTNHANVMTQKLAILPNQLATLQKAQTECATLGYSS